LYYWEVFANWECILKLGTPVALSLRFDKVLIQKHTI